MRDTTRSIQHGVKVTPHEDRLLATLAKRLAQPGQKLTHPDVFRIALARLGLELHPDQTSPTAGRTPKNGRTVSPRRTGAGLRVPSAVR